VDSLDVLISAMAKLKSNRDVLIELQIELHCFKSTIQSAVHITSHHITSQKALKSRLKSNRDSDLLATGCRAQFGCFNLGSASSARLK